MNEPLKHFDRKQSERIAAFVANELSHIDHHAETLRVFGVSFINQLLTFHITGLVAAFGIRPTEFGARLVLASPKLYVALLAVLVAGAIGAFFVKVFIFVLSFSKLRAYREYLRTALSQASIFDEENSEKFEALDWSNGPTREKGKIAEILAYLFFALSAACLVAGLTMFILLVLGV